MINELLGEKMATDQAHKVCRAMRQIMKEKRMDTVDDSTGKPISLRALCARTSMDVAILSRAEKLSEDTVPALSFWLDWTDALGVELGDIVKEARKLASQSGD